MEDIFNELEEISAKDNYGYFVDYYREQQEIVAGALSGGKNAHKLARVMRELSNLFMRTINYKYAIRRKHVDMSKQMLEKDFLSSSVDAGDELSAEIECSAMLLVARAWLRSKLTYLQVSGPLWARIRQLIEENVPLNAMEKDVAGSLSVEGEECKPTEDQDQEDALLRDLTSLATSIYRYVGTYGSSLSLDLELRTQADLVEELREAGRTGEVPEKILSEFDDVIDDAFDYDRLRSTPQATAILGESLVTFSGNNADDDDRNNNFALEDLVPLGNQQIVDQWLEEYVDPALVKQTTTSGGDENANYVKQVDLRSIEMARKLHLSSMGLPCELGDD